MYLIKSLVKALVPKRYLINVKEIYLKVRSSYYIGDNFFCPCCEGHFREFLPLRNYPNLFVMCPRCESLERHRLLWMYFKERTNIFAENVELLHIAPEFCFQKIFEAMPNIHYITADLKSRYAKVKMDITKIQYEDNLFDAVLCNHVLEHIEEDKKAMREIFRTLKPGGWAILQSPIDLKRIETFENPNVISPEERKRFFGQSDHVRIYGRDYKEKLEHCGFNVRVDNYVKGLSNEIIDHYKLDKDEDIYFCIKPLN